MANKHHWIVENDNAVQRSVSKAFFIKVDWTVRSQEIARGGNEKKDWTEIQFVKNESPYSDYT